MHAHTHTHTHKYVYIYIHLYLHYHKVPLTQLLGAEFLFHHQENLGIFYHGKIYAIISHFPNNLVTKTDSKIIYIYIYIYILFILDISDLSWSAMLWDIPCFRRSSNPISQALSNV